MMGSHNLEGPEKTLVFYEPDPQCGSFTMVVMWVLFFLTVGFLASFYGLEPSRFPYSPPGYVEVVDYEVDGRGSHPIPSGEYEYVQGGYATHLYQVWIPTILLVWFSFQLGLGSIVARAGELRLFVCLGCFCLISYSAGWLLNGDTTAYKVGRYALFGISVACVVLSLAGAACFRYSRYSYYEPEAIVLMAHRISRFGGPNA